MSRMKRRLFRAPKLALGSLAVAIAAAVCGCRTIGYYAQAVRGECQIGRASCRERVSTIV